MRFHLFNEAVGRRQDTLRERNSVHTCERRDHSHVGERGHFQKEKEKIRFQLAQKSRQQTCSTVPKAESVLYVFAEAVHWFSRTAAINSVCWHVFQGLHVLVLTVLCTEIKDSVGTCLKFIC